MVTASSPTGQWSILCFVSPWMKFSLPSIPAFILSASSFLRWISWPPSSLYVCLLRCAEKWLRRNLINNSSPLSFSLCASPTPHFSPLPSPSLPGGPADLTAEGEGRLVQWAAAQLWAAASWVARARRRDWQAGEPHPRAGAGLADQRWVPGEG